MKFRILPFLLLLLFSDIDAQNLDKIKQSVFGNLVIGAKLNDYFNMRDSLSKNGVLLTNLEGYNYFKFRDEADGIIEEMYLFPIIIFNSDSIITEISYYVYSIYQISNAKYDKLPEEQRMNVTRNSIQNYFMVDQLKSSFLIEKSKAYPFPPPSVVYFENISSAKTEKKIPYLLTKKYGNIKDSVILGDKIKNNYYSKEYFWKTSMLDIAFIKIRLPYSKDDTPSFYYILNYKLNVETIKKYNIDKQKGIKESF